MGEYYSVAVPSTQKIYSLGKRSSVKFTLPLLIEKMIQKDTFIFYLDGGYCEDIYEYELQYEKVDFDYIPKEDIEFAELNSMSNADFDLFYEKCIGKEINWEFYKRLLSESQ